MADMVFKLGTNADKREIIMMPDGSSIAVYHLSTENIQEAKDKIYFYGTAHGQPLAFEFDMEINDPDEITGALHWYAAYLNFPDMELLLEDPRPRLN